MTCHLRYIWLIGRVKPICASNQISWLVRMLIIHPVRSLSMIVLTHHVVVCLLVLLHLWVIASLSKILLLHSLRMKQISLITMRLFLVRRKLLLSGIALLRNLRYCLICDVLGYRIHSKIVFLFRRIRSASWNLLLLFFGFELAVLAVLCILSLSTVTKPLWRSRRSMTHYLYTY